MFGLCFGSDLECFIEGLFSGGDGTVMLVVGGVIIFLFLILLVGAASSRRSQPSTYAPPPPMSPRRIAKERLAEGEITVEEFEKLIGHLD